MQYSIMTYRGQLSPENIPREIFGTIDNDDVRVSDGIEHADIEIDLSEPTEGLKGPRILVHIALEITTPKGKKRTIEYRVPVLVRESSMVLVGSDGENRIENAVIQLLLKRHGILLEPLTPKRENVKELLTCTRRIEKPLVITGKGVLAFEEIEDDTQSFWVPSMQESVSWDRILSAYPLASANLVFQINDKELLIRFFLDSFWLDDDTPPEVFEYAMNLLEQFLVEGRKCERKQGEKSL